MAKSGPKPGPRSDYAEKVSPICGICFLATCIHYGSSAKRCPVIRDIERLREKYRNKVELELKRERRELPEEDWNDESPQ
jgi:hypothetical protein